MESFYHIYIYLYIYYIRGFNESRYFMYTKLYEISSKYYCKTYFIDPNRARTCVLPIVCLKP